MHNNFLNYKILNDQIAQQIQLKTLYDYTSISKTDFSILEPGYEERKRQVYMEVAPEGMATEEAYQKWNEGLDDVIIELADGFFLAVKNFDASAFNTTLDKDLYKRSKISE